MRVIGHNGADFYSARI